MSKETYRMGGGSTWSLYRRVIGLLWKNVGQSEFDLTPSHCVRIFGTRWMLQVGRFKESRYSKPLMVDGVSVEELGDNGLNPDKAIWMDDLRNSVK